MAQWSSGHQYVAGSVLVTIGIFSFIGSITGTLAPMLAALFAPSYLVNPSATGGGPGVAGQIEGIVKEGLALLA